MVEYEDKEMQFQIVADEDYIADVMVHYTTRCDYEPATFEHEDEYEFDLQINDIEVFVDGITVQCNSALQNYIENHVWEQDDKYTVPDLQLSYVELRECELLA